MTALAYILILIGLIIIVMSADIIYLLNRNDSDDDSG
jgi:hypothetical protein